MSSKYVKASDSCVAETIKEGREQGRCPELDHGGHTMHNDTLPAEALHTVVIVNFAF